MITKRIRYFVLLAGGILLWTAVVRFMIAAGDTQALVLSDPVLGMSIRHAVLIVGFIEVAVAMICLFGKRLEFQVACLIWLSTNFIVYWVSLVFQHIHPQSTCIGSLTDPLQLYHGSIGYILKLVPFFIVFCSYCAGLLLWLPIESKIAGLTRVEQPLEQYDKL